MIRILKAMTDSNYHIYVEIDESSSDSNNESLALANERKENKTAESAK